MESYLSDLLKNSSLMIVTATVIVAILVEASRKTRPLITYFISIIGLVIALILAVFDRVGEDQSFGGMLLNGGFSNFFGTLFCVISILTATFARFYFERQRYHRGEFYILLLFATIGMMLMASANDLIILFLGIELMSVCLYVTAGFFRGRDRSNEAALKYFLLGAFATGFLLYGIALIYGAVGTTNLSVIKQSFLVVSSQPIFILGTGLFIVGLSFKVAAVPFHMWAPDVYEGAPTPVTVFMSTGAKAAAFAAFITVFIRIFEFKGGNFNDLIAILATGSMVLGNILAIAQTNIKRMLAYSSVAHVGYMLSGIAAGTLDGQVGVMFYLVAYALMNLGAFVIIGLIEQEDDRQLLITDYTGLSRSQPILAALMAIFMFALAGVPPFAGFFGKYYVFFAAVKANMTWLAIVGVLMSLVSAYYYLRIIILMYFQESQSDISIQSDRSSLAVIVFCAIMVFGLGLFPSFIIQLAQQFH